MSAVLAGLVASARRRAARLPPGFPGPPVSRPPSFREAVAGRARLSVIAEFKRRSPSSGRIREDDSPASRARRYRDAGAAALSVLTDPDAFGGSFEDLSAAARVSGLPVLMKDFVVHPAQIRAGRDAGAAAVLLIVRCLEESELRGLHAEARAVGLDTLAEVHTPAELERALDLPEAIIGINNRDLDSLEIDRAQAAALLPGVPSNRIAVAESGYLEASHLVPIRGLADAVLVGTALMRAADPAGFLRAAGAAAGTPQASSPAA